MQFHLRLPQAATGNPRTQGVAGQGNGRRDQWGAGLEPAGENGLVLPLPLPSSDLRALKRVLPDRRQCPPTPGGKRRHVRCRERDHCLLRMNSSSLFLGFCVRLIITRKWGNHDMRGNTGENTPTLDTVGTWGCSTDGLESPEAPLLTPCANHPPNQWEPHQNKPLETEDGTRRPTAGPRVS